MTNLMILHDLRYAVRTLRRTPVFTSAALLSLSMGIGTSATVFSLIDSALIAIIALSLAATGVYAVTAYLVTSRTREIGVRMALGATAKQITTAMIALRFAVPGAAVGLLGAVLLGRIMRATLYETTPLDS